MLRGRLAGIIRWYMQRRLKAEAANVLEGLRRRLESGEPPPIAVAYHGERRIIAAGGVVRDRVEALSTAGSRLEGSTMHDRIQISAGQRRKHPLDRLDAPADAAKDVAFPETLLTGSEERSARNRVGPGGDPRRDRRLAPYVCSANITMSRPEAVTRPTRMKGRHGEP